MCPSSSSGYERLELAVIAKSEANDDVIVQLGDGRFDCIHLTWNGKIDAQPDQFPSNMIFDNIESLQIYINEVAAQYAQKLVKWVCG